MHYECDICNDTGGIYDEESRVTSVCKCQNQRRLQRLFKDSQITPAFQAKTFSNYIVTGRQPSVAELYNTAFTYTKNFETVRNQPNNWIALMGEPGAGKTHLLSATTNNLITKGVGCLYFQHAEGMTELMDSFNKSGEESIAEKLRELKRVEFLFWDDLWKVSQGGKISPFEIKKTFEVLNYRYLEGLPTAISTEHTPEQLLGIDKAIASRIIERARGHMKTVEGIEYNYRLTGGFSKGA